MSTLASFQTRLDGSRSWYYDGLRGKVKRLSPLDWEHHLFMVFSAWECAAMANAGKSKGSADNWSNIEFVNITLLVDERKAFDDWLVANDKRISAIIGDIMADDYRLSCSWDGSNECFIATLTGKKDQKYNANRSLSSRSDNWWEAIALTVYKHVELSHERKWSGASGKNNWG